MTSGTFSRPKRRQRASSRLLAAVSFMCSALLGCSTDETLNICSPSDMQEQAQWAADYWTGEGYQVTASPSSDCSAKVLVGDWDGQWGGYAYPTSQVDWILVQRSSVETAGPAGLSLLLAHETGHLLGLGHSDDPCDIMSADGIAYRDSFDCQVGRYGAR